MKLNYMLMQQEFRPGDLNWHNTGNVFEMVSFIHDVLFGEVWFVLIQAVVSDEFKATTEIRFKTTE